MSAFYSLKNKSFEAKDRILVFDMGGGTTDFSLFEASSQKDIKRLKVSDHILLGGDNVDLYIAKILESKAKAENKEISKRDWAQLKAQARVFKEKALEDTTDEDVAYTISLAARGSSLFASSYSLKISKKEILDLIIDGFFSSVKSDEKIKKK